MFAVFAAEAAPTASPAPIRSAAEMDYPPFSVVDAQGRADGFSVELLRATLRAMEREVTFETGPWHEVKARLELGRVAALPLVGRTPEREEVFDFTFPYMTLHGAIVVRTGEAGIETLEDLQGRRVAVMAGDNAEEFLRRDDRASGIEIVTRPTFSQALVELSQGSHDAVVIQRLVALRLLQVLDLANLHIVPRPLKGLRQDFCFAVRKGDSATLALLNEGLALIIADGTYRRLHAKWFAALELPSTRRIIVGGDRDFPPFEFLDDQGRPSGLASDLTRTIAREMGLDVEIRLDPWSEVVRSLNRGEVDIIQGMYYSAARGQHFDFSPAYLVNHYVAVTRRGEGAPPADQHELAGRRLVVQRGDLMHEWALEQELEPFVTAVKDQEAALREVVHGRRDVALVARLTALHWIDRHGWDNLVVAAKPLLSAEYCFAVAKGNTALLTDFDEGLRLLKAGGQFRRIQDRWLGITDAPPITLRAALRYVAMVAVPLILLLLGAALWSWSLRRQVAQRTAELRQSEERAWALFESSPDAVFVVGPGGRYVEANSVALERYGYSHEEFLALTPEELVAPDLLNQVEAGLKRSWSGESQFLWRHRTREGREIPVAIRSRPFLFDGSSCILVSARDISEQVTLEEQLRQSQKMEAIGNLAGGVAHDFNNLLQAMMTQVQLLKLLKADPSRVEGVIGELEQQALHGASLTRQLLLFSRRETAAPELLDLGRVVQNSAGMLRRLLPENIAFSVDCSSERLLVMSDPGQLQQLMVNLVVNASHAMPHGGSLAIRAFPKAPDLAALEVEDSGHGVPEEIRSRIFEPFFTTKSAEHGTGLGLAVVHGIVARHGAVIELDSEVGKGSTFRVLLPRRSDTEPSGGDGGDRWTADLQHGRGESVLLVEDEEGAREGLREILTALGYRVTAVGSAEEAGLLPADPAFDLLLTDLVLPGAHGPELAESLAERWPGLKIILMSGHTEDHVVRRGAADGTLHFLQKPFDMDTLAREIREALSAP